MAVREDDRPHRVLAERADGRVQQPRRAHVAGVHQDEPAPLSKTATLAKAGKKPIRSRIRTSSSEVNAPVRCGSRVSSPRHTRSV
ncbi:hypothetical protein STANM309S_04610 [Streptomyces tanashiensis]